MPGQGNTVPGQGKTILGLRVAVRDWEPMTSMEAKDKGREQGNANIYELVYGVT